MCCGRWSNEAATVHADITADHRDVPTMVCTFEQAVTPLSSKGLMHFADVSGRRHFVLSSLRHFVDWTFGLLMTRDDQTSLSAKLTYFVFAFVGTSRHVSIYIYVYNGPCAQSTTLQRR